MTPEEKKLYFALPLTGSQVRILTVEAGEYEETLRTKLRVGYLLHESGALLLGDIYPVQYKALSYRWGLPGEPKVKIFCNNWKVCIGESAFQALTRLRQVWQPVDVWIDTVCMNQGDVEEKSVQVPRMRDIYANAEEVVVWLGQGKQHIRDLLDRLAHTPDRATAEQFAELQTSELGKRMGLTAGPETSDPKSAAERVQSMQTLLELPWFSRVWCKQEIWAARKASLRYEDVSCEWENFNVDFFECMIASTTADVQSVPGMKQAEQSLVRVRDQHARADSATLGSVRDKDESNPLLGEDYKLDIVNVIRRCHGSQCGDERDFVYGLMGMSSVNRYIHEEDDKKNEMLAVSYSQYQSPVDTYEDLARYIIGRDDNLSILFLEGVFDHEQPREVFTKQPLPTWVPDWRRDYGSLKWLTSKVSTPLSEKQLRLSQIGVPVTTQKDILSRVRFPLLVSGYRIGTFNGETLSPQRSSSTNGWRRAEIAHMKTGLLSMSNWFCERLTDEPPIDRYPGFVPDGVSIADMVWAVPKKARAGDVAIAVHGAYAPLLVRPFTDDNTCQFTLVGPTVLPDAAYPFARDEKADAGLTKERSSQLLPVLARGKQVTDRLSAALRFLGKKGEQGEHFEII